MMGTQQKNKLGTTKIGSIGHMLQFLIGSAEISILNITYFGNRQMARA
jgi:hypothetical protein